MHHSQELYQSPYMTHNPQTGKSSVSKHMLLFTVITCITGNARDPACSLAGGVHYAGVYWFDKDLNGCVTV